eukprot:2905338-Pyramimonas_sp.AAC.1
MPRPRPGVPEAARPNSCGLLCGAARNNLNASRWPPLPRSVMRAKELCQAPARRGVLEAREIIA